MLREVDGLLDSLVRLLALPSETFGCCVERLGNKFGHRWHGSEFEDHAEDELGDDNAKDDPGEMMRHGNVAEQIEDGSASEEEEVCREDGEDDKSREENPVKAKKLTVGWPEGVREACNDV